ncbi:glycosyltransferase family 2 protein [Candidatus Sumerlaeota bacterium]|nr:glycosyltransferase family 2 protein [Candidatus Sumerlaeota bacterium]
MTRTELEILQPRASIIIRAFNESRHLGEVLRRLHAQRGKSFEIILVDSGSTDGTREIAERAGARVLHIAKEDFTFGRSLNVGCKAARGEFLVFISGHCYPVGSHWLDELLAPFAMKTIGLTYGKQRGGPRTKFSEHRHFQKTFRKFDAIPQDGFFCNNANSAIRHSLWRHHPFDESLTGLEDLGWAKWLDSTGGRIAYASRAGVYHLHDESWPQVFRRYEREAIALKHITPDLHFSFVDFLRLFLYSAWLDGRAAFSRGVFLRNAGSIAAFRLMQYWGTWRGFNYRRAVSRSLKEKFYYPHK